MALHGEIKVNAQVIAGWSARRIDSLDEGRPTYTYECEVSRADGTGTSRFRLEHDRKDGAGALAAAVISNAAYLFIPIV